LTDEVTRLRAELEKSKLNALQESKNLLAEIDMLRSQSIQENKAILYELSQLKADMKLLTNTRITLNTKSHGTGHNGHHAQQTSAKDAYVIVNEIERLSQDGSVIESAPICDEPLSSTSCWWPCFNPLGRPSGTQQNSQRQAVNPNSQRPLKSESSVKPSPSQKRLE
jgi:hypothetical protein